MAKWLGHRDLCPVQWGGKCDCEVKSEGMICARCDQRTNNRLQGHYWKYCKVTRSLREFHFCCPNNCELEERPFERVLSDDAEPGDLG